jgi:hypothetical protein
MVAWSRNFELTKQTATAASLVLASGNKCMYVLIYLRGFMLAWVYNAAVSTVSLSAAADPGLWQQHMHKHKLALPASGHSIDHLPHLGREVNVCLVEL